MLPYILRRSAAMLAVLFCVVTITFILVWAMPGSPFSSERSMSPATKEQLEKRFNLSGPLWVQLTTYWGVHRNASGEFSGLLQGDLQMSTKYRDRSVEELLRDSLPVSMTLGFVAFILATTVGIWLGTIAAVRHHSAIDAGAMLTALFLISIPTFVVGPLLILVFAIRLGWLPVGRWDDWTSVILPAVVLAGPYIAYIARLMRTSMLEVLGQDFVRTARAKGLSEAKVIYRHVLKVALLPVITYLGPLAANLLTGSLVVETIFNLPGAGPFFVNSILNKDSFLLGGVVIVYCTLLLALNLVVDIAYTYLDRRINFE
jgi:oligopeptide transport system permease protein